MAGSSLAAAEKLRGRPVRVAVNGQCYDEVADYGGIGARERLVSGLASFAIVSASLLLWGAIIAPFVRL